MSVDVRAWLAAEIGSFVQFPPPRMDLAARLEWIGLDPIGLLHLELTAEKRFGILIDGLLAPTMTFGEAVALIERHRDAAAVTPAQAPAGAAATDLSSEGAPTCVTP